MNYAEYKRKLQDEFNALPIFFAYGKEQFREALAARGLTLQDVDKVRSYGYGGYYLAADAPIIRAYHNRPDPLHDLMADPAFAESAFYSEMMDHEYHINWDGDADVCACFGAVEYDEGKSFADYLREQGYSDGVIASYARARRRFMHDADELGWY